MSVRKRLLSVICVFLLLAAMLYGGLEAAMQGNGLLGMADAKESIVIWYTDEALTDYINSVAYSFYEDTDVRVDSVLVSGLEYLESINKVSVAGKGPDVFIISHDSLEKAYLAGLASQISDTKGAVTSYHYPQSALDAVTYHDTLIAYPLYFETAFLLYNYTHLQTIAQTVLDELESQEQLQDSGDALAVTQEDSVEVESLDTEAQVAEDTQEELLVGQEESIVDPVQEQDSEEVVSQALEQAKLQQETSKMIPSSIVDILEFASSVDAPEGVKSIFKWDVSDIFFNYFFTGNYMLVGGPAGDDESKINIYNSNSMAALMMYQKLNQFFSIDAEDISYTKVLDEFIAGETIFTVVTTDALAKLEVAKAEDRFAYEYGVAMLPDLTEDLQSKGLSVTSVAVVNGYSAKKEYANLFSHYLTYIYADTVYARTGKVASRMDVTYENPWLPTILLEYGDSIAMPKMIATSNFWVQLEICFMKAWEGGDINQLLKDLSEQIKGQIRGEIFTEQVLESPTIDLEIFNQVDVGLDNSPMEE